MVNISTIQNDVINSSSGCVYISMQDKRYEMAHLRNISISYEFDVATINCIGMNVEAYKPTIIRYSGTAEMYYNSSRIRELVHEYQESGKYYYYTITAKIEDTSSNKGSQEMVINNVLITKGDLLKLNTEDGILTETIEFKCTGYELRKMFTEVDEIL